ncbi:MAG: hypothetical protein N3B21_16845 [Clostridia bacterium]|nr:hypothetical protein [Clostridia bacterium]
MQIVPFMLALLLVLLGTYIRFSQKATIEKWVGYNIVFTGLLVLLESILATHYCWSLTKLSTACLITMVILFIITVIGFVKWGKIHE